MTLQNGAVIGKRAFLWTDTAYFSGDGASFINYAPKAFTGLEWPFAVSWSAVGSQPFSIADRVGADYPKSVPELLSSCRDALIGYCASSVGSIARLLVAAHDRETGKPRLFMIASESLWDFPPFAPIEGLSFVSSHNDHPTTKAALEKGFTLATMLDVIDVQKASPFISGLGTNAHLAGNCVQIEVSRRGAFSSVARVWDDPAGALAAG